MPIYAIQAHLDGIEQAKAEQALLLTSVEIFPWLEKKDQEKQVNAWKQAADGIQHKEEKSDPTLEKLKAVFARQWSMGFTGE